jgi:hypothetical protein
MKAIKLFTLLLILTFVSAQFSANAAPVKIKNESSKIEKLVPPLSDEGDKKDEDKDKKKSKSCCDKDSKKSADCCTDKDSKKDCSKPCDKDKSSAKKDNNTSTASASKSSCASKCGNH